jgi:hypothetical protein
MLHNVAILPTRTVSGKLLNLFLVSVPAFVNDLLSDDRSLERLQYVVPVVPPRATSKSDRILQYK